MIVFISVLGFFLSAFFVGGWVCQNINMGLGLIIMFVCLIIAGIIKEADIYFHPEEYPEGM